MPTQNKTMAIKARVANHLRKSIYKKEYDEITVPEKLTLLRELFDMGKEMHKELSAYKQKRKDKKAIQEARVARGYKPKVKTTKAQWEQMHQVLAKGI